MELFTYWNLLTIIAIFCLFNFSSKINFVWGGLALGAFIGMVISIIHFYDYGSFDWYSTKNAAVLGTVAGTLVEITGRLTNLIKTPKHVTKKHH